MLKESTAFRTANARKKGRSGDAGVVSGRCHSHAGRVEVMSKRQSLREFEAELRGRGRGRHSADPPRRQSLADFESQLRLGRRAAATHDGRIPRHRGDLELTWE